MEEEAQIGFDVEYDKIKVVYQAEIENGKWEWHEPGEGEDERERNWHPSIDDKEDIVDVASHDAREAAEEQEIFGENVEPCCAAECNKILPLRNLVRATRQSFQELSECHQDLMLLSFIQSQYRIPELKDVYTKHPQRGLSKSKSTTDEPFQEGVAYYFYRGLEICMKMFLHIYDIDEERFKNLEEYFRKNGLVHRRHRSIGKMSTQKTTIPLEQRLDVIAFIKMYAGKHAIPLPGHMAKFKNHRVVKLPAAVTKKHVYRLYIEAIRKARSEISETSTKIQRREVAYPSFLTIWNMQLSYIVTAKPTKVDLCDICMSDILSILRQKNGREEQTLVVLRAARTHLWEVKSQRQYYQECRQLAKERTVLLEEDGIERDFKVLSFDFAEQVHYPSNALQVGSACFKTPRKCEVFGVHNERSRLQVNYLIDEADSVGKDANTVVSLLHSYLSTNNADVLILFAYKYIDQNNSNTLMRYLQWRVNTSLNTRIELNLMSAGHTQVSTDRSFGVWKYQFSQTDVDSLEDLITVIESSPGQYNVAVPTISNGERSVIWNQWSDYLAAYFRTFPCLTGYQKFEFMRNADVRVARQLTESQLQFSNLPTASLENNEALVIEEIVPKPMSALREWYLYEEIRDLVHNKQKKDRVAPKPPVLRPLAKRDVTITCSEPKISERKPEKKIEQPVKLAAESEGSADDLKSSRRQPAKRRRNGEDRENQ